MTMKEILEYVLATTGRNRLLIPLPFEIARIQAWFLQCLPKPPLTPDQVELLKRDTIVSEEARRDGRTLEGLGITPVAIEAIAPSYLWRYRKAGQFSAKGGAP
jgi:NADH dehydrogenase